MSSADQQTRVGLLRIRAAATDPLAVQMRGHAALRPLDLRPPAMPPHAILCVRRMSDPLPGAIDLRTSYASRATEWERAARTVIARAFSSAVRPLREPAVATDAEAVLFEDRAELLACAARDVARGARPAWYWEQAFRSLTVEAVVRELAHAPRYLPVVVELLARSGDAVPFARLLSAEQVALLCRSMELKAAASIVADVEVLVPSPAPPVPAQHGGATAASLPAANAPEIAASEAASTLTVEQYLLLLVLLTLHRAPEVARGEGFARRLLAWKAHAIRRGGVAAALEDMEPQATPPPHFVETAAPPPAAERHAQQDGLAVATASRNERQREIRQRVDHPHAGLPEYPEAAATASQDSASPLLVATLATDHAGLFFLLNAAMALGYYRDPPVRRLDLHPWDFLALAGRALVPELEDEPLFELLDGLAPPHRRRRRISRPLVARMRRLLEAFELPPRFVVRRYGRIAVTPAHVGVWFSLEAHPIEIRMAGLDRDPGWIPEAGRHVAFHFD